jgi:hypothetical protein
MANEVRIATALPQLPSRSAQLSVWQLCVWLRRVVGLDCCYLTGEAVLGVASVLLTP